MKQTTNKSNVVQEMNKPSKNVNSFRHLINPKEGSAEIISFVQSLRTKDKPINLLKIPDQAFNVYGNNTEASKQKKKVGDYELTMNQEAVEHIYKGKSIGYRAMAFSQSLRKYDFHSQPQEEENDLEKTEKGHPKQNKKVLSHQEKEYNWNIYSKIADNFYPAYVAPLNKQSQKMLDTLNQTHLAKGELSKRAQPRILQKINYYSGFDGHSNQKEFNCKLPLKNLSDYKFLLREKQDINKNTLGWVSQLRSSYANEPLHRQTKNLDKLTAKKDKK